MVKSNKDVEDKQFPNADTETAADTQAKIQDTDSVNTNAFPPVENAALNDSDNHEDVSLSERFQQIDDAADDALQSAEVAEQQETGVASGEEKKLHIEAEREALAEGHERDQHRLQLATEETTETADSEHPLTQLASQDTPSRSQKKEAEQNPPKNKKQQMRFRLIPLWLRLIIIMILVSASLLAGIYVGFAILGPGDASEAFKLETWKHILDLVNKT